VDILIQFSGLALLIGGVVVGYQRWIKPRTGLSNQSKGMLLLIVLTFMGGMIGSIGWWMDDARSFSWDLPPLASRMLAAAAWSFAVPTMMALQRPSRQRVQLMLLMLFTYLAPLAIAIRFFHLDRFDSRAPITYAFFIIVIGMLSLATWYLVQQPEIIPAAPQDTVAPSRLVKSWLVVLAILTGLWGIALFITDTGFSNLIWVWPGDLLTSRLIAVMLLTIAVGAIYSLRYADAAQVLLTCALVYGFGIMMATLWNGLTGQPIKYAYVVVFGAISIICSLLLRQGQQKI
jgi:hypothetical protein